MPRPLKTKSICHTPAVKSTMKKKRIGASPAWLMNTHVHTNRYTTRFSLFLPLACTLCLANRFRCNSFLSIRKGREIGRGGRGNCLTGSISYSSLSCEPSTS